MKLISFKHLVIGLCMFAAAGMALALKPTAKAASTPSPEIDLETLIPAQFGDWKIDETIATLLIADPNCRKRHRGNLQPDPHAHLRQRRGRAHHAVHRLWRQPGRRHAVHRPEVCYPAQGFQVVKDTQPTVLCHRSTANSRSSAWSPRRGRATNRSPTG